MAGAGWSRNEGRRRSSHSPTTGSTRPPDLTQQLEEIIAALNVDGASTALSVRERSVLTKLIDALAGLLGEDARIETEE
jgi:hypothetical protein